MIYRTIQPSTHLKPFVRQYLLLHFRFNKQDPSPVKPFPASPNQGITFYPRGFLNEHNKKTGASVRRPQVVIFGQQVSRFNLQICSDEYLMIDVRFQPGILSKFIRLPLHEFVNQNIDAEAVLSVEIQQVNDQLVNAKSYDQMIKLVEDYLWKRVQQLAIELHPMDKISRLVMETAMPVPLDQWADHACLSISAFERRFLQYVGVSPKLFARISRFDQAFQLKETNPKLDWLSIALQLGYTDYQHLVKDFKQFAGTTPTLLIREESDAPEKRLGLV